MSTTEAMLFISLLVMMGLLLWVNDSWAEECSRMNREWYDLYKFIIASIESCRDDLTDESEGSSDDHQ